MIQTKEKKELAYTVERDEICGTYYKRAFSYTLRFSEKIIHTYTLNFAMHGLASGCGLGVFASFTGLYSFYDNKRVMECLKKEIKNQAKINGWYCLISALGQTFYKSNTYGYEKFLIDLGFKQIHEYTNKNDGPDYKQRVYQCNPEEIK